MWLIQVDLQGHTRWVESIASWPHALDARRDFVERLTAALEPFRFFRSHWAGDGGLFVAQVVGTKPHLAVTAKSVLKAAYASAKAFKDWQSVERDRSQLGIRISLHQATIWPDDEPGNWFSVELNRFMKFERDLAIAGAISMTDVVYRSLPKSEQGDWFPTTVKVGDAVNWTIYWNKQQKIELEETTFVKWLSDSRYAIAGRLAAQLHELEDTIVVCGNCLIIAAPVSSVGFENKIELEELATTRWMEGVPALVRAEGGHDFAKVCPVQIHTPLTDSPKMVIRYVRGWYKWAREFGREIEADVAKRVRYGKSALTLDRSKGAIPDILCSHIVVILEDRKASEPWLLICQRAEIAGQVDFESGSWTVSIEEQYRPAVNLIDGKAEKHDTSIHESVVRGLREELGIPDEVTPVVETHGLFVEADQLRTAILAVARVMLDFDKFKRGIPLAIDRGELRAAVVVPLNKSNVECLLDSEAVPEDFLSLHGIWVKGGISADRKNVWHTSSKLRLVLARWLLEPRKS